MYMAWIGVWHPLCWWEQALKWTSEDDVMVSGVVFAQMGEPTGYGIVGQYKGRFKVGCIVNVQIERKNEGWVVKRSKV